MNIKIKKDKYKSARGGYSRILDIYCRKCMSLVLVYQKDGPGGLRRLYLDRIFAPQSLVDLQFKDLKDIKPLKCNKCDLILGTPYLYKKEKRKAFRLYQDYIIKQTRKIV